MVIGLLHRWLLIKLLIKCFVRLDLLKIRLKLFLLNRDLSFMQG